MSSSRVYITDGADDGYVYRFSTSYPTLCTGNGTGANSGSGILDGPGDKEASGLYTYYKPIFVFDLSDLEGTPTSITMTAWVAEKNALALDIYIHKLLQDPRPIGSTDYQAPDGAQLCIKAHEDINAPAWNTFVLDHNQISLGEVLPIRMTCEYMERINCFIAPASGDKRYYRFATKNYGLGTLAAYLDIEYQVEDDGRVITLGEYSGII